VPEEPDTLPDTIADSFPGIFVPAAGHYNRPARIVTLGHVYAQGQGRAAKDSVKNTVRESRAPYGADPQVVARNAGWTRLVAALNAERQWPLRRLFELLDPLLVPDIAVAAVPPHRAYQAFWPARTLAQRLAADGRVDATACLVRHTTIRRIVFGGPSTRALHRATVYVEEAHLIQGRRVLLLEAGASAVQAVALGRVIVGGGE